MLLLQLLVVWLRQVFWLNEIFEIYINVVDEFVLNLFSWPDFRPVLFYFVLRK